MDKEQQPFTITKDMNIIEVIQRKPSTLRTLMSYGLGCMGCPSAMNETIEQAAGVHGLDPDKLVESLNEV